MEGSKKGTPHADMMALLEKDGRTGVQLSFQALEPNYFVSDFKDAPLRLLRSTDPKSYIILTPAIGEALHTQCFKVLYGEEGNLRSIRVVWSGESSLSLRVPFNLDEFLEGIQHRRSLFLPLSHLNDLHRSHVLSCRGSHLFSQAVMSHGDKPRILEVDLSTHSLVKELFAHFDPLTDLTDEVLRKKTKKHMRLFFNYAKVTTDVCRLETAVHRKAKGDPVLYARILMTVLKDTAHSIRESPRSRRRKAPLLQDSDSPKAKLPRLSASKTKNLCENIYQFLEHDSYLSSSPFICPKCYKLKVSKRSLASHLAEVHYKESLSPDWNQSQGTCTQRDCQKKCSSMEEMRTHLGVDHGLAFEEFIRESEREIKSCLWKNCSFLTLGYESLLNHLVFNHCYERLSKEIKKAQTLYQLSPVQCPITECQRFIMKEKLMRHYALDHGTFINFLEPPNLIQGHRQSEYYEVILYGHIKSNFSRKYTCSFPVCLRKTIFSSYMAYLIHLSEVHYSEDLRGLMKNLKGNKCPYGNCSFTSFSREMINLHVALSHKVVLSIDTKHRMKPIQRFNLSLLRMYDCLWPHGVEPMYSYGDHRFRYLINIYDNLSKESKAVDMSCIPCAMKFPRPSDSDFLLDDIIYHSISKEHILNYHLLSSKTTYEPFPVLDPTSRYCFICNKLPDLDHHLTAAHQNGLRSMSKYIHFSVFKGFNPLTCDLKSLSSFVKYLNRSKEQACLMEVLKLISHYHKKGSSLLRVKLIKRQMVKLSGPPAIFTCLPCNAYASKYEEVKKHFHDEAHERHCGKKPDQSVMVCLLCNHFFLSSLQLYDLHRHSPSHLGLEHSLFFDCPVVQDQSNIKISSVLDCSLCDTTIEDPESHVLSLEHMGVQSIADEFYEHCRSRKANPVTCELPVLKAFLLRYGASRRKAPWALLHRIHSGMDLVRAEFSSDPQLSDLLGEPSSLSL